ncbi:porin [Pseudoalteromonas sp. SG44-17]|uniref:porin n=1 Tax=Pseudoalteromonas sp. SG44-17 TaxID=2760963 RepID=UPI001600A51D|nr:porin [Pseudoalteromonas sp. SG44-17]MBB1410336.1 porin [Pseudoalteromonas sp. SG44-17]
MKQRLLKAAVLPLMIALPSAANTEDEGVTNKTSFNFYGTLRPTFGITSNGSEDSWDVKDALSRIGFSSQKALSNGMTAFATGEFKIAIDKNGDLGEARKAFVGIKGDFGRVAIGKQWSTIYNMLGDPVDIFNRASSPLAYDHIGPYRINNYVSYRKIIGDFSLATDVQIDDENEASQNTDRFNTGLAYSANNLRLAVAYYIQKMAVDKKEIRGVSAAKSFGDLYLAATFTDTDDQGVNKTSLDMVAAYKLSNGYKLKIGISDFDSSVDVTSFRAYNATLEWHPRNDFYLFGEVQTMDWKAGDSTNSFMVGLRYNFDYGFKF